MRLRIFISMNYLERIICTCKSTADPEATGTGWAKSSTQTSTLSSCVANSCTERQTWIIKTFLFVVIKLCSIIFHWQKYLWLKLPINNEKGTMQILQCSRVHLCTVKKQRKEKKMTFMWQPFHFHKFVNFHKFSSLTWRVEASSDTGIIRKLY